MWLWHFVCSNPFFHNPYLLLLGITTCMCIPSSISTTLLINTDKIFWNVSSKYFIWINLIAYLKEWPILVVIWYLIRNVMLRRRDYIRDQLYNNSFQDVVKASTNSFTRILKLFSKDSISYIVANSHKKYLRLFFNNTLMTIFSNYCSLKVSQNFTNTCFPFTIMTLYRMSLQYILYNRCPCNWISAYIFQ